MGKIWNVISLLLLGPQKGMTPWNGVGDVISFDWNHNNCVLCYSSRLILGMFESNGSFFFFFSPDRPTAEKTLVKNPPFKESTDCGLRIRIRRIYFTSWVSKTVLAHPRTKFGQVPPLPGIEWGLQYQDKTVWSMIINIKCCGQLWVWHMICGQTCDGLYHVAFYLSNFGIPLRLCKGGSSAPRSLQNSAPAPRSLSFLYHCSPN